MSTIKLQFFKHFNTLPGYLFMVGLGLFAGFSGSDILHATGTLVSDIFIRIFKCISLPIIALSLVVTLAGCRTDGGMRAVWQRTLLYTFTTTLIAAVVSALLYLTIRPESVVVSAVGGMQAVSGPHTGYVEWLSSLVPDSLLAPFVNHQVIGVLMLGIVTGIAIRYIPDAESRETVTRFFRGLHGLMMVITAWVIRLIPLALFGFVTTTVTQLRGGSALGGIGKYLAVVVLANLVQGLVVLPLWLKSRGINPFDAMRRMMPALSVAFLSKSSVGTLPVTMETAEKQWQVSPGISRFVLPLCTSLNMNGCAAFIFATVVYLMQNHGITLSLPMMGMWVIIATIAAIGNAGVPMGCFFLSMSLLASMNVPITLMGIILPFYGVIDMLETSLNVWSDSCVAKVVDERQKEDEAEGVALAA
ncbi:amino acid transporter [Legionella geestiana]|uniref:Amino acid transporter n=1 Tax=Legionella geestiana TaxID=45065 RepID=A0A0W0TJS7_9GAMM|nr:dicarboxylate/amino acid:cation symporter [Legionella geestiana]KTC95871.1 amino acid transporter [Legionella geestiana]QBS13282.1 dicarboxylate/amino acid:cation symporter [Legionella geestiana]QDQ40872.1 dicarboxylate/amino acid:cation symporter [Legionella geestiana]STX54191.1 amino acid transporter [Legionella geestiana]